MRVYLIGYMGCGKSTVGRKISRFAHLGFVDTDSMVEREEGATVADIITFQGEEHFRTVERRALEQTATMDNIIVSTGGGLPMWGDNMERISQLGLSIYLRRSPENIISRLSPYGRQKRPKFRGLNDEQLLEFMTSHMAEREPIYSRADVVIDCDKMADNKIIDTIIEKIVNLKR
ncbi:MAG: shikimate kinase [Rikenellaceae bacterium]|nr:shikimate kinase [Rikenellaceae bacterium]